MLDELKTQELDLGNDKKIKIKDDQTKHVVEKKKTLLPSMLMFFKGDTRT